MFESVFTHVARFIFVAGSMTAMIGISCTATAEDGGNGLEGKRLRPTSTFSIIAYEPETGYFGAAVQTHWFAVGVRVLSVEPGVGAVATQAFTNPDYGPLGLELMKAGKSAPEALSAMLASDENREVRQAAMLDVHGNVAGHTGRKTIREACNLSGENYSVQANTMDKTTVCTAMARAFENGTGDLADRLMAALHAAQAEGGDIRGRQSAALKVVKGDKGLPVWRGWVVNLRVDDHKTPIKELERLLGVARVYAMLNEGDDRFASGDIEGGLEAYAAAEAMDPENHEALFWHGVALVNADRVEDSLPVFRKAFELWPKWRDVLPRLQEADLLPDDEAMLRRILE
jgi:uncharacterized Ntn-hydrolase superfamily protein